MNKPIENNTHLKQNNFKVPDGYFEKVQSDILNKVRTNSKSEIKSKVRKLQFVYSAAASIAILIVGGWFFINNQYSPKENSFAVILEQRIYDYDTELLESYAMEGRESELADEEDLYLVNSKFDYNEILEKE